MQPFEKSVITEKTFDQAVAAIEKKAAEKGFRVLHTHDIAATLSDKGFSAITAENHRDLQREVCQPRAGSRRPDLLDAALSDQRLRTTGQDAHQHVTAILDFTLLPRGGHRAVGGRGGGHRAPDCR